MSKKLLFFVVGSLFIVSNSLAAVSEYDDYKKDSYPYKRKFADVYIGGAIHLESNHSISNAGYGRLFNPEEFLPDIGISAHIGLRPFEYVSFFRNFRIEGEHYFHYSYFDIKYNQHALGVPPRTSLEPRGQISLQGKGMVNAYFDFRYFSDFIYPYVGYGTGLGYLKYQGVDYNMLENGTGEQYRGRDNVRVKQLIVGFQVDNKIIKSSFFIEYRYLLSTEITIVAQQLGTSDPETLWPPDFQPPPNRKSGFKAHMISFGLKYYLY